MYSIMHLYFSGYVGRSCEGLVVRGTNQTVTKVSKDNTFFHLYFLQMTISFIYPLSNIAIITYYAKQACIFYEFSFWALLIINKNTLLLVMTTHQRFCEKWDNWIIITTVHPIIFIRYKWWSLFKVHRFAFLRVSNKWLCVRRFGQMH